MLVLPAPSPHSRCRGRDAGANDGASLFQGAGFVGSHLVDRLMLMGHDVICIDNFFTGTKSNVGRWISHPNFELIRYSPSPLPPLSHRVSTDAPTKVTI